MLIINGTKTVGGAEYVLKDYLYNHPCAKNFTVLASDLAEVTNFYDSFFTDEKIYSKLIVPAGANKKTAIIPKIKKLWRYFNSRKLLKTILATKKHNTVIGNNIGDMIYSKWVKKYSNCKFIAMIHDTPTKTSLTAKLVKLFDSYIDHYVVVSNTMKKQLVQCNITAHKITPVYNGLVYTEQLKTSFNNSAVRLAFVGNLDDRKNPLEFINAWASLPTIIKNKLHAKIVYKYSSGDMLTKIQRAIAKYQLDVEIIQNLPREQMPIFYQKIDFLVITSKNDPLPTVILEAFNNAVPVIGHEVDGIPEMIEHEKNGFLYKKIGDLTNTLQNITKLDQQKYINMSKNANLTIKNKFDLVIKINKLDKLLL